MEILKTLTFVLCLLYTGFLAVTWTSKNTKNTLIKILTTVIFLVGVPGLITILKTSQFDYLYNINVIYPAMLGAIFLFSRDNNSFAIAFKFFSLVIVGLAISYFIIL